MSGRQRQMSCGASRANARGFSLIEILVALVVMAMALGVLYNALGGSTRSVDIATQTERATLWARTIMARWPQVGAQGWNESGETADGFRWAVRSAPYGHASSAGQVWRMFEVEVVVAWGREPRARKVRLFTILHQFLPEGA